MLDDAFKSVYVHAPAIVYGLKGNPDLDQEMSEAHLRQRRALC